MRSRYHSSAYLIIMFASVTMAGFLPIATFNNKISRQLFLAKTTLSIRRLCPPSRVSGVSIRQQHSQSSDTALPDSTAAGFLREILHESLKKNHLDPELIYRANEENMRDPTVGYDAKFGRPAVRTYRAFIFSNKSFSDADSASLTSDNSRLLAAADRCAQQIDFLRRRHLAQSEDWVRNHDVQNEDGIQQTMTPAKRFPIILVLDNLRSAFNVGSIFRTADACACQEVITTGITAHPGGSGAEKLSKSALGSERFVPNRHFRTTQDALDYLKNEHKNWTFVGMETTENSVEYSKMKYSTEGIVLILGNEVTGVDPGVLTNLDSIVEIPMFGTKNSLNVAACAPVVLYEIIRQWGPLELR